MVAFLFRCCGNRCGRYLLRNASTAHETTGAVTVPQSTFIDDLGRLAGRADRSDILLVREGLAERAREKGAMSGEHDECGGGGRGREGMGKMGIEVDDVDDEYDGDEG